MATEVTHYEEIVHHYSVVIPFLFAPQHTCVSQFTGKNQIFNNDDVQKLSKSLTLNNTLTQLNLWGCSIGAKGALSLATSLEKSSLTFLELGWNSISIDAIATLSDSLQHSTVTYLGLAWNDLGAEGAKHVANLLTKNTKITELNLSGNNIKEGVLTILTALESNKTLTSLNLTNNGLSSVQFSNLLKCNTLISLSLRANSLFDKGTEELMEGLKHNKSLQSLDLQNNNITAVGAKSIASYLSFNPSVKNLNLQWNHIGEGFELFIDALSSNVTITALHIKGNNTPKHLETQIFDLLSHHSIESRKSKKQD